MPPILFRTGAACLLLLLALFASSTRAAETIIPLGSTWKYFKGAAEASNPTTAWRDTAFDDSAWSSGPGYFFYGEALSGTALTDMRNLYTTLFLRKSFTVSNPADFGRLIFSARIDDGFIIWLNGKEVTPRFNAPTGEPLRTDHAPTSLEMQWVTNTCNAADFLVAGENVVAVQVFNQALTSTDIVFDLQLSSSTDRVAPTILSISPTPGAVQQLNSITVTFSEPVSGVTFDDLLINNSQANAVTGSGAVYTFTFDQPAFGVVDVSWESGHAIGDLADPPNAFDEAGDNFSYTLSDTTPPTILTVNPPNGSTVRALTQVDVRFSEEVTGLDASDLLINGAPATNVTANGNLYSFRFAPAANGAVTVTWAAAHGITDLANPANPFVGQTYSYTVDPNFTPAVVVISEFLAAQLNPAGLVDEDGELQDWIELYNASASPVNLEGWSLTDDPEDPDLWLFPNVTIPAGGRLVVFASMKDRRPTTGNLHTNFKLNAAGEYLALFNAESPRRVMTELDYPEQRNDYSYGLDAQSGWQYFQTPTPRAANGSTTIVGLIPKLKPNIKRGAFDAPFTLVITNEVSDIILYTTDGSEPTAGNGKIFDGSLVISNTTIFRAVGTKSNYLPSETLTESYIFLDQVLAQPNNPPGFPVGPTAFSGYPSDYEMDPEIVNAPEYKNEMKSALQALPIISIAIRPYDMWDANNGIYTHPLNRGPAWERPCSIEFMAQDGKDFQENAGIQIQGNAAREPIKNPKHPMRVVFKGDYGASKLNFKMFPDSPLETFDTLILRADFNNQWLHWNPAQRVRGQRIRDSWMKDSMRAMGGLASHNRYCHLYINGVYWGIYDPTERPDGSFGAGYLGGKKADYDVVNEGAAVDGTMTAYNTMLGISVTDINQYNLMKTYLDMPQFIDYMLLHFYVGHEDWGLNKNWYTLRPKDGSSGFKYVPWDGEMILGDTGINRVSNSDVPSGLHTKLMASAQYKIDFADRVQKHMFNDGALTPAQNAARWRARSSEIVSPIIAESARWGDYRRDVHQYQSPPYELYTRNVQWAAEQARLTNTYFPSRTAAVLNQLKAVGLYPNINAPAFNKYGGQIAPGFQLTMSGAGTIYYTTNGVDPRVYGTGAVSDDAKTYAGAITLNGSAQVKARILSGTTWSALTEATFSDQSPRIPIRFTEIMYNPEPPGDAYEYLELQNFSELPMDVSGWYITGIDYIFPPQSVLQPGQIILLGSAQNIASFKTRYGVNITPFGYFGGQLGNGGERVAVVRPDGRVATAVPYDDEGGWAPEADGRGYSLEVIDPLGDPADPANWRASAQLNGTLGRANPDRPAPPVVFNEIYSTSTNTTDFLELRSQATTDVDLSGWTIWKVGNPVRFAFPSGTTLTPGAYLVVQCDRLTNEAGFHSPYALDSDGDTLVLSAKTGVRVDARSIGVQVLGKSSGLLDGKWQLLTERTPGADNSPAAELGSPQTLVFNEWFSNPPTSSADWLEIHNTDQTRAVDLRGLFLGLTNQMFEVMSPVFVGPGAYARLYADQESGGLDFKLPAEGGTLKIYDALGNVLHQVTYTAQSEGISTGRFPDGAASIVDFAYATPGAANTLNFPVEFALTDVNALAIAWPAIIGARFQVQAATELTAPINWQGVTDITAQNNSPFVELQVGADNKFFRVVRLP